jgi:hypothetical protein
MRIYFLSLFRVEVNIFRIPDFTGSGVYAGRYKINNRAQLYPGLIFKFQGLMCNFKLNYNV